MNIFSWGDWRALFGGSAPATPVVPVVVPKSYQPTFLTIYPAGPPGGSLRPALNCFDWATPETAAWVASNFGGQVFQQAPFQPEVGNPYADVDAQGNRVSQNWARFAKVINGTKYTHDEVAGYLAMLYANNAGLAWQPDGKGNGTWIEVTTGGNDANGRRRVQEELDAWKPTS